MNSSECGVQNSILVRQFWPEIEMLLQFQVSEGVHLKSNVMFAPKALPVEDLVHKVAEFWLQTEIDDVIIVNRAPCFTGCSF